MTQIINCVLILVGFCILLGAEKLRTVQVQCHWKLAVAAAVPPHCEEALARRGVVGSWRNQFRVS